MAAPKGKDELNIKQRAFCQLFVTQEFFGNATASYIEAYDINTSKPGAYLSARVNASQLLTKTNILKYIDSLLDNEGLNEQFVDKQLLLLITQNADYSSKMSAIKEFNKLKGRITEKIDHKTTSINYNTEISEKEAARLRKAFHDKY